MEGVRSDNLPGFLVVFDLDVLVEIANTVDLACCVCGLELLQSAWDVELSAGVESPMLLSE